MSEAEEFEFAAAMEAEQASAHAPPTPAAPPIQDPNTLDVAADMGREFIKGAGGTVDFLSGMVGSNAGAVGELTPEQQASMTPQDYANLPMGRAIPAIEAGQNEGDYAYRGTEYGEGVEGLMTGANFMGGAVVPLSPVRKLKQATDLVKGAGLFGAGAGAFDAVTEDTGEMGKVGAGLTSLLGAGGLKSLLKSGSFRDTGSQSDKAAALINNIAQDSEAAMARAKAALANGEKGTLGQITQDPYILSLEKGAMGADSKFSHQLAAINEEIAQGASKNVSAVAPVGAKPESMLKQAKARVNEALESVGTRTANKEAALVDVAAKKENVLAKALGQQVTKTAEDTKAFNLKTLNEANPSATPITAVGSEGQRALSKSVGSEYGKVWDKVDHLPEKSWVNFKNAATEGVKKLADPADKDVVKNIIKMITDVRQNPSAGNVKSFDTALRNAASSAQANKPALYDVIKDMRTGVRDGLDGKVAERLKELDGHYGKYLTVRKAGASADGVYTPEQLNTANKVVAQEKRFAEGEGFLEATTKPELGKAAATIDTTKALEAAGKESLSKTAAQSKALRTAKLATVKKVKEKSVAGQFAKHDDAVQAVDKVLGNTTAPVKQTKELIRIAKKDGTGEAVDGLKAAYIQSLAKRITSSGKLDASAADKFKTLKKPLGELFEGKELRRIESAIKDSEKIRLHADVKASHLPEAGKGLKFYTASIFGIKAATAILSGNSLLMGRVGREAAVKAAVGTPHKKLLAAMEDMLINPAKYTAGINKIKAAPTEKNIAQVLGEWGVRASAAGEEPEK